ncbi:glycosyltransferase [Winogradskyella sp. A2]|uniref:glycosyltransferase n=1 Tax=Winogradskyella sp. A2 TaxID=3366944 RepID=UPI00398C4FDF
MGQSIVHVINDFPSKSETFIVNHIVETIKEGWESHILVNNLKPKEATSQLQLFNSYGLYDIARSYNVKIPKNKVFRILKASLILLKNLRFASVFFKTLNNSKYGAKSKSLKMWFQAGVFIQYESVDIFHGHFAISGQLLADMKEIGAIKGKIVTTFYGYDTFSTEETRNGLELTYKNLFKYSDLIITSSKYLVNNLKLLKAPEDKVVVNPVGVDINKFQLKNRTLGKQLNLVTVGRLIKLKGQHLGIEAVKSLVDKGHQIHYTIIGSGEERNNLQELISQFGVEEHVTIKQTKSQIEVIDVLNDSHLFLMTSITDKTGRAEGQGLVTAEAQSTGIPVIGFNSGGIPETIKNGITGFIIEEKNVKELVDTIQKFFKNPELIDKMGRAGRKYVEKEFNSKIQSKKIIDLYKAI